MWWCSWRQIVGETTPYVRKRRAAQSALGALRRAVDDEALALSRPEQSWLERLPTQAEELPEDETAFIELVLTEVDREIVRLAEYEFEAVV
jgi:hypothetical protein